MPIYDWGAQARAETFRAAAELKRLRMGARVGTVAAGGGGGILTASKVGAWAASLEAETQRTMALHSVLSPPDDDPRAMMQLWTPIDEALVRQRDEVRAAVHRVQDLIDAHKAVRFHAPA